MDSLRPRRGVHGGEPPALLVVPEDDIPVFTDRFHRAMATAGLARQRVRITSSISAAAAEVLAGAGLLLCDGGFARRHGLPWTPLADARLHRGYELAGPPGRDDAIVAAQLTDWLAPLLGAAVGAAGRGEPPGDDPRAGLVARA